MPIYEFYCPGCHTVFSFFSKRVNTETLPPCPRCRKPKLERQVSSFALGGGGGDDEGVDDFPIDESRMERAIGELATEAEHINDDDPRQAAKLMRKFSSMAGMKFGDGMESALGRMEAGEDPDAIEAEMGDLADDEEPFVLAGGRKAGSGKKEVRGAPGRDDRLYDM